MATLETIQLNKLIAPSRALKRGDDGSIAFKILAVGSPTTALCTVKASGTAVETTYDATVATYDVTGATYDTLLELKNGINAAGNFTVELVDSLGSMSAKGTLVAATVTCDSTQQNVYLDTDAATNKRHVVSLQHADAAGNTEAGYQNRVYEIVANVTDTTSTATLYVYTVLGTVETLAYQRTLATGGGDQVIDLGMAGDLGIDGGPGARTVVMMVEQTAAGFIEARGKSWNNNVTG